VELGVTSRFFVQAVFGFEAQESVGWLTTSHLEKEKDNEEKKASKVG
jgi:hypothetical protein